MQSLIKYAPRAFLFLFLTLLLPNIGCKTEANPNFIITPDVTPLSAHLPASRYLSTQSTENIRPAGSTRGYDPDYRLINPRRLERIDENPAHPHPDHIEGLRDSSPGKEVRVIRNPANQQDIEISSQVLLDNMFKHIENPKSRFIDVTLKRITDMREAAIKKNGPGPRVIVAGMGPTGLLTILEAYSSGASIIGIEQRSQYTRPQILRLTPDTIKRLAYFAGPRLWSYFIGLGYISRSPNWSYNKYDLTNEFLYPEVSKLKADKQSEEQKILDKFSQQEKAELKDFKDKNLELESVEIIRINQLETFMAALIEKIAKNDPDHIRIFYGSVINAKVDPATSTLALELDIMSGDTKKQYPISGDVLIIAEGSGSRISKELGLDTKTISDQLHGSTVALRLPHGFDITLRPIENREGTASVKGIAIIDPEKLTAPGQLLVGAHTGNIYTWTMIDEKDLCKELNQVLENTATQTNTPVSSGLLFPCDTKSTALGAPWKDRNGGKEHFLPRTRYFFTGGIAYLGAELNDAQYALLYRRPAADNDLYAAERQEGLKKYLLLLAKKHMPREYVEGRGKVNMIHPSVLTPGIPGGNKYISADGDRVITVTEEAYSLTAFPIELKKANEFFVVRKLKNPGQKEKDILIVQEGDTYGTTHFFTGSGAVNGLEAAMSIGKALNNGFKASDWEQAGQEISTATDKMHSKVMRNTGNAPLDGPYNKPKI